MSLHSSFPYFQFFLLVSLLMVVQSRSLYYSSWLHGIISDYMSVCVCIDVSITIIMFALMVVSQYGLSGPVQELPNSLLASGMPAILLQSANLRGPPPDLCRSGPGVSPAALGDHGALMVLWDLLYWPVAVLTVGLMRHWWQDNQSSWVDAVTL